MRLPRSLVRSSSLTAALGLALALLAPVQAGLVFSRGGARPAKAAAAPLVSTAPATPRAREPRPPVSTGGTVRVKLPMVVGADSPLGAFRALGTWVDLYDLAELRPQAAVASMRAHGVRTLYFETARYNTPAAVDPATGGWLRAAHAAGMKVVGWYVPGYASMRTDVACMVAIARFRDGGERFDAAGIDIEVKHGANAVWNARVASHAAAVRRALGPGYPLAAITPTPLGMGVAPARWAGFPWRALGRSADVVVLMSYWSYRGDCPRVPSHCAYAYTRTNVERARSLTGRPVHVIGGVGDLVSAAEIRDFVRGARDAAAFGASVYDFRTTSNLMWDLLRAVRTM
jgi:hypothetical protein